MSLHWVSSGPNGQSNKNMPTSWWHSSLSWYRLALAQRGVCSYFSSINLAQLQLLETVCSDSNKFSCEVLEVLDLCVSNRSSWRWHGPTMDLRHCFAAFFPRHSAFSSLWEALPLEFSPPKSFHQPA